MRQTGVGTQKSESRRAVLMGVCAVLAAWTWMFLTVHYNYGGNWTALYLIGPRTPVPPSIPAERLYIFPNSSGYDGQSYHVMAHDPWLRRSTPAQVEIETFRYARILVPAMAWMIALGQDRWIDPAYYTVILAFVFVGAYWTALYAARASLHPAWGLAFLLSPAMLTSLDRMTVDIALAAWCVAFALYVDRGAASKDARWRITLVLACALLTRETAWILLAAYEIFLVGRRRFDDAWLAATAAIPAVAWQFYVASRAGESAIPPNALGWIPGAGLFDRLTHPVAYDLAPSVAHLAVAFDYLALAGVALAVVIAIRILFLGVTRREPATAHAYAIFGFALIAVFLVPGGGWDDAYAFGRILAPLLVLIAMYPLASRARGAGPCPADGVGSRIWLGVAPTLLVDSRIALNLGKQAMGVLRGLLHWA
jgi:hypothetical protein